MRKCCKQSIEIITVNGDKQTNCLILVHKNKKRLRLLEKLISYNIWNLDLKKKDFLCYLGKHVPSQKALALRS